MHQAHKEIEALNKRFTTAAHGMVGGGGVARYSEEYVRELDAIVTRHGAEKRVAKTFTNGLRRIEVVAKDGTVIAEWTDAA